MNSREVMFSADVEGVGEFSLVESLPDVDCKILHSWVTLPYAKFWGMNGYSITEVQEAYRNMVNDHTRVYLGAVNGQPVFLLESYDPACEAVSEHYSVEPGDRGMHVLIAPADQPIAGFSAYVFQTVLSFLFSDPSVKRIVVEPDCRNDKIHRLNKRFGFFHQKRIQLPDKQAYLAVCSRAQFDAAIQREQLLSGNHIYAHLDAYVHERRKDMSHNPATAVESIQEPVWTRVNRELVKKAIAELSHERVFKPEMFRWNKNWGNYRLMSDDGNTVYEFRAQILPLEHWYVDVESLSRRPVSGVDTSEKIDAVKFVLDFHVTMGIKNSMLPTYMEEITSTLCSAAFKYHKPSLTARQLVEADFQAVEASMNEGHPCFIANNGRIGFGSQDFRAYAPEAGSPITLIWIAAHKRRADFASSDDMDYDTLMAQELDAATRHQFEVTLTAKGVNSEDYLFIPVHPWQWFNKLASIYTPDIAAKDLICLGYGDDSYLAQQSIRTFFNISQPGKFYVKTALSILNMGFMRGLSSYYMRTTPVINDWLRDLIAEDAYLQERGFDILRELAAVGYSNPYYEDQQVGDSPYKKMLAALWRENPLNRISTDQRLMTMASLLHVDVKGEAVLPALIASSGLSVDAWLKQYLQAYLSPLLHCLYQHRLVFMPHGENLILVLENNVPVKVLMKDIGEEICVLNSDQQLPDGVDRISVKVPPEEEVLAIFTDVFDCFFRFVAQILYQYGSYSTDRFWHQVAMCVVDYQNAHPELNERFQQHDLFAPEFALSCLNRLHLNDNQQMIDLADPSKNLQFFGTLNNPIARYRSELNRCRPYEQVQEKSAKAHKSVPA